MTHSTIREAVEFFRSWEEPDVREYAKVRNHTEVLLSLAERYLSQDGWPEKMICSEHGRDYSGNCQKCKCCRFFNWAIDACRLAALKDKEQFLEKCNVKELENIIFTSWQTNKNPEWITVAATAIRQMARGEE